jgi:voltage-gated potassium channel
VLTDTGDVVGGLRDVGHSYLRRRYSILFYTLLFTMVVSPMAAALGFSGTLVESLLAACLLVAVMPVHTGEISDPSAGNPGRSVVGTACHSLVWTSKAFCADTRHLDANWAAGRQLRCGSPCMEFRSTPSTCLLLIYWLAFTLTFCIGRYWALNQVDPAMFSVGDFSRSRAIYFSFVTLATLGYGDIVPHTDVARSLAVVEGVGRQLFLAVLVARLVSLYSSSAKD